MRWRRSRCLFQPEQQAKARRRQPKLGQDDIQFDM